MCLVHVLGPPTGPNSSPGAAVQHGLYLIRHSRCPRAVQASASYRKKIAWSDSSRARNFFHGVVESVRTNYTGLTRGEFPFKRVGYATPKYVCNTARRSGVVQVPNASAGGIPRPRRHPNQEASPQRVLWHNRCISARARGLRRSRRNSFELRPSRPWHLPKTPRLAGCGATSPLLFYAPVGATTLRPAADLFTGSRRPRI
jgi:hypothetical protein